jgi:phosphatidylserine decarboxylase
LTDPSVLIQHLLPKQAITALAGRFASARAGALTHAVIRRFVARYGVDMDEAAQSDPAAYACFNDFFTRALKPGVRPLAQADWICPVDGAISQFGPLDGERLLQAKGHHYTATALLGGEPGLADAFGGEVACCRAWRFLALASRFFSCFAVGSRGPPSPAAD